VIVVVFNFPYSQELTLH